MPCCTSWAGLLPCWTWTWPAEVTLEACGEQLRSEGCVCNLHAFFQSLEKSVTGWFQQEFPHQFPPMKQPEWKVPLLCQKERAQSWNSLRGLSTNDNNNNPIYFAGQVCTSYKRKGLNKSSLSITPHTSLTLSLPFMLTHHSSCQVSNNFPMTAICPALSPHGVSSL